jgi:hypothetical protein
LKKSSINPSQPTVSSVKSDKYVSFALKRELFINHNHCKIILSSTIKNTVNRIIAHPIVGVPAFVLCSFAKRVAFQMVASLRICFQSFNSCNILMNIGVNKKPTKNVAIQNVNINTK